LKFKKLLFLPLWLILLLCLVSAAALSFVFVKGLTESIFAYAAYVLSFYTLCCLCIYLCMVLPQRCRNIKKKVYSTSLGGRYMTDAAFRTNVSLHVSFAANLLYSAVNILSFIISGSAWFFVLALYYVILAVMRFLLVRYVRRKGIGSNRKAELKRSMLCSCILLLVNFALSGAVLMILYRDHGFDYPGLLIYAMATYTFYITVLAIVNLVRYRKYNSPLMTMTKIITLSAALVSMLSLETAMFAQFGQSMPQEGQRLMIALTGAAVAVAVIAMSLIMIIRSHKEIKNSGEI